LDVICIQQIVHIFLRRCIKIYSKLVSKPGFRTKSSNGSYLLKEQAKAEIENRWLARVYIF